ncbi:CLIP-associating protein 2 isoform h [Mus musculus]|uniref:Isoform 3 of CLIP-associating protein 2 n=1 Tax=Mus musculus TaxID=10090 RepID=Q8BRT1-6|nr:CLIP-associating protein 2 isoform h [Mus musculus]AAH30468.1 Clasp2 protein [Mus musculus]BAB23842.1 unnamed protein product [Mus musculus]|eukprot:NP_001273532.1 CLIP-associating protein 2 isoform h [Mus musculus]
MAMGDDKSFDDEESVDGNRPSSAASAFKVPAPKTPGNPVSSARKPGSAGGPKVGGPSKEGGAGAVDEDDFIKAFTDVPSVQIYSSRELEETLNKIREILSDDKHDWDQRANACMSCSLVASEVERALAWPLWSHLATYQHHCHCTLSHEDLPEKRLTSPVSSAFVQH